MCWVWKFFFLSAGNSTTATETGQDPLKKKKRAGPQNRARQNNTERQAGFSSGYPRRKGSHLRMLQVLQSAYFNNQCHRTVVWGVDCALCALNGSLDSCGNPTDNFSRTKKEPEAQGWYASGISRASGGSRDSQEVKPAASSPNTLLSFHTISRAQSAAIRHRLFISSQIFGLWVGTIILLYLWTTWYKLVGRVRCSSNGPANYYTEFLSQVAYYLRTCCTKENQTKTPKYKIHSFRLFFFSAQYCWCSEASNSYGAQRYLPTGKRLFGIVFFSIKLHRFSIFDVQGVKRMLITYRSFLISKT